MLKAIPSFTVMASNTKLLRWPAEFVAIDTCANVSFVGNRELLRDVKPFQFSVSGATGEGGGTEVGTTPGFGQAAYLPDCKISALAACDVFRYECRILAAESWTVCMPGGLNIVFEWSDDYCMYVKLFDKELIAAIDSACSGLQIYVLTAAERENSPSGRWRLPRGQGCCRSAYIFLLTMPWRRALRRAHILTVV